MNDQTKPVDSSCKIGDIVEDKKGQCYKILGFTNSLFFILEDLTTNQLVISSDTYYYKTDKGGN